MSQRMLAGTHDRQEKRSVGVVPFSTSSTVNCVLVVEASVPLTLTAIDVNPMP